MEAVYTQLAHHVKDLVMGFPFSEALPALLEGMFTPEEARVALGIPGRAAPLEAAPADAIARACGMPLDEVERHLRAMMERNVVYTRRLPGGQRGYALLQVGWGMPQAFFWGGVEDERAREMARRVLGYFKGGVTARIYGGAETKSFRYAPAELTVEMPKQGVLPFDQVTPIVEGAQRIAVAHCPCRMSAKVLGRTDCPHPLEVCLKYDDLAEYLIDRDLGREVSRDEAMEILAESERQGLVHMVDNAQGQVKHTCNCCGCYCWNVGPIRRRKIPRDTLMAVYFLRTTDLDGCVGCGLCAEVCPVDAVVIEDGKARVDQDWCIGCGVCAVRCPGSCVGLERRREDHPPATLQDLFRALSDGREA